jgi:molybdopterin converting factor subunit 1
MMLTVHLFAAYADAFGQAALDLSIAPGATVGDLVDSVRAAPTRAGPLPDRPLVAVNQEYASYDRVLEEDDEVALIPPVAGG